MSDEWTRSDSTLHQTNDGDVVQIRLDSDPLDVAFSFNPSSGGVAAFYRWLGIAYTPTATTPTLKLRPTGTPGDLSYPLLVLQDQAQANLAKWEASGSIDLIRKFLKNAGKITFQSEVAEQTQYTCMFEKDGDFYWAINAVYDGSSWNRVDPDKYAYLLVVWSKHNVDEGAGPPSGPMWYRAIPRPGNPAIEGWQAQYGWETGLMVTEDRNLVLGGINLEVDGSGNKPHGRFTHIAHNDASGQPRTLIQQTASYDGSDWWGRDLHVKNDPQSCEMNAANDTVTCTGHGLIVGDAITFTGTTGGVSTTTTYYVLTVPNADSFTFSTSRGGSTFNITADGANQVQAWVDSSALVTDLYGNWEFWFRDALASSPWHTADWERIARLHVNDGIAKGRLDVFRRSGEANLPGASFLAKHITSADMVDGFASGYAFAIQDNAGVENILAAIYGVRDGADNTGKLSFHVASAGLLAERMSLTAAGRLVLGSGAATRRLNVYETGLILALFEGSGGATAVDIKATGTAGRNALLRFYNTASGIGWETGQNAAAAAPLTNAFCWSLSQGVMFTDIKMSLSTGGVLNVTGSYQVAGVKVVGAQQAHIADADGTLADITTKFNTLLTRLETHGLLASA